MSKIGRLAIKLPENTTLNVVDGLVVVKGKLGELSWKLPSGMMLEQQDGIVKIINQHPENQISNAVHGLSRAKIANLVTGVSAGFERILDINGVGFRAELHDDQIWLHLGFSHPIKLAILEGVNIKITKNELVISGIDKGQVGEMAARIRSMKKPEPYKGKGIKYREEVIRRKQGKAAKSSTG